MNGFLLVNNASLTYLPRALKFSHCNTALVFHDNDMLIKTMQQSLGKKQQHFAARQGGKLSQRLFFG